MIRNHGKHQGKAYLSETTISTMLSHLPKGRHTSCGFFARKKSDSGTLQVIGHSGSSGTECWIDFENDIIGILLTQTKATDIKKFRSAARDRVTGLLTQ